MILKSSITDEAPVPVEIHCEAPAKLEAPVTETVIIDIANTSNGSGTSHGRGTL